MKVRVEGGLTRSLLAVAVVVVLAGALAACGSSSSGGTTPGATPAAGGTTANVSIQGLAFTPKTLTVAPGTTVTWTNNDPILHNVTSADSIALDATTTSLFASGSLSQGQTFSFTFTRKGTYFYECTIHKTLPAMHAEVVVK